MIFLGGNAPAWSEDPLLPLNVSPRKSGDVEPRCYSLTAGLAQLRMRDAVGIEKPAHAQQITKNSENLVRFLRQEITELDTGRNPALLHPLKECIANKSKALRHITAITFSVADQAVCEARECSIQVTIFSAVCIDGACTAGHLSLVRVPARVSSAELQQTARQIFMQIGSSL
jgi:hypothetical protein